MRNMTDLVDTMVRMHGIVSQCGEDGCLGSAWRNGVELQFIASWASGWEHVSAKACEHDRDLRIPTWEEMCYLKELFWRDDECVMQLHPPKAEYINCHPCVLHLWKPVGKEIHTPPLEYV